MRNNIVSEKIIYMFIEKRAMIWRLVTGNCGYLFLFLAFCFVLTASSFSMADNENLIKNGSFESPSSDNPALPAGWRSQTTEKVRAVWEKDKAKTGERSVGLIQTNDKWQRGFWHSDSINVKPGMAYRISFSYMAKGGGVPVFTLNGVKTWRLSGVDTDKQWISFTDEVVVPLKTKTTKFSIANYNRPGKSLWLDDVRLVELPLSESPLTLRMLKARRATEALKKNAERFQMSETQRSDLDKLSRLMTEIKTLHEKLSKGKQTTENIKAFVKSLDQAEAILDQYQLLVWGIEEKQWLDGERESGSFSPASQISVKVIPGKSCVAYFGILNLGADGVPFIVRLKRPLTARKWDTNIASLSAYGDQNSWGKLNPMGELYLPPGQPRFIRINLTPNKKMKGEACDITLEMLNLERPAVWRSFLIKTEGTDDK